MKKMTRTFPESESKSQIEALRCEGRREGGKEEKRMKEMKGGEVCELHAGNYE